MVSIWWIVWSFLIGGYVGMLLVALVVLSRKVRAPG
jgi:RsiW-degrading membrane proteinase PrsW (M82 family)